MSELSVGTKTDTVGIIGAGKDVETVVELARQNTSTVLSEEYAGDILKENLDVDDIETVPLESLAELPVIFWAAPLRDAASVAERIGGYLTGRHILIHLSRGFASKNRRITEVIKRHTPVKRIGFLTGPLVGADVQAGRRASGICATAFPEVADICEEVLESERFLMYRTPDIVGGELASAYARLLAFAIGLCTSLELGRSLEATLFSRGLSEMARFVEVQGGRSQTVFGLAGCGNLRAQTGGQGSLDFRLGEQMAAYEGDNPREHLMEEVNGGYELVRLVERIGVRVRELEIPDECHILRSVSRILDGEQTSKDALDRLFSVPTHFE